MRALLVTLAIAAYAVPATAKEDPFPQWGFELRIGTYQPTVGDQTVSGSNDEHDYYQLYFGKDRPLMFAVEFDRYLAYVAGHLGFFFQAGLWKNSGKSRRCTDASGADVGCTSDTVFDSSPGSDKTQLQIVPLTVGAIYRFDFLQREFHVPIVPYGKVGFAAFYWRSSGGGTLSTFSDGSSASGWTTGIKAAIGLGLNLDFLTPAGHMDHTVFVDSYFFVEGDFIWADGFGNARKFDMSDTQLQLGFAFDFE